MPARAARRLSASGKLRPSRFITKLKMSPPSPQPKQCQLSRAGVTTKLGVFSPWNGQSPLYVVPAFFSCTTSPTISTIDSLLFTSAATPTANQLLLPCQTIRAPGTFDSLSKLTEQRPALAADPPTLSPPGPPQ